LNAKAAVANLATKGLDPTQGCQMASFQTKNPNLGKFWRSLEWKMLVYFYDHQEYLTAIWYVYLMDIWYILWSFGIYFSRFGMFYRVKSGNPDPTANFRNFDHECQILIRCRFLH
jgi:hypothetical protein